jgi:RNA polymerase sigma factor FliA
LRNNAAEPAWSVLEQTGVSFASLGPAHKDRIARAFAPRIKIIALHLKAKLPSHIELSDLISAGTLGLMEAFGKFQPDLGIRFETFADSRIRGSHAGRAQAHGLVFQGASPAHQKARTGHQGI